MTSSRISGNMELKIEVFSDVMLCHHASNSLHFGGSYVFIFRVMQSQEEETAWS